MEDRMTDDTNALTPPTDAVPSPLPRQVNPALPIPFVRWPYSPSPTHKKAIGYLRARLEHAANDGSEERVALLVEHGPQFRSWDRAKFIALLEICGCFERKIRMALEYLDPEPYAPTDADVPEVEVYVIRGKKPRAQPSE